MHTYLLTYLLALHLHTCEVWINGALRAKSIDIWLNMMPSQQYWNNASHSPSVIAELFVAENCGQSVCTCVCPRAYLWNRWSNLHQVFVHVSRGPGSVFLWRRFDIMLHVCRPTAGFVDAVMFVHNTGGGVWCIWMLFALCSVSRRSVSMSKHGPLYRRNNDLWRQW